MKKIFFFLVLVFSFNVALSQVGTIETNRSLNIRIGVTGPTTPSTDSTWLVDAVIMGDQLSQGYSGSQVAIGDRIVDQLGNQFKVSVINSQTSGAINVDVIEVLPTILAPTGNGVIFNPQIGNKALVVPENSQGISSATLARILNHNFITSYGDLGDTSAVLRALIDGLFLNPQIDTFRRYCPSHGVSLASYTGEVAAIRGECDLANALAPDSLQTAYIVDSIHLDTVLVQVSGVVNRPSHGLNVGEVYFLQDSPNGESGISQGTEASKTFVPIDDNNIVLIDPSATGADLEIPVVNIPAAAFSAYGTDPKVPNDTTVQNIAEAYAAAFVIRPGSYLIAYNAAISDNEIYRNNADGSSTPFHVWQWNGTKVTRISSRPVAISTQDTLYGGSGLLPLDTIVPAGSTPTTAEVVTWLTDNYNNNGLRLPNGSVAYFPGTGSSEEPEKMWFIMDDLSSEGATNFDRIVKLVSGGGGGVAGSSGAVQFNDAGVHGADDTNFFWDDTNKRLGIATETPSDTLDVAGSVRFRSDIKDVNNATGTANQVLMSLGGSGAGVDWVDIGTAGIGDNLGDHTATQNIVLDSFLLTNNGTNGIRIGDNGDVELDGENFAVNSGTSKIEHTFPSWITSGGGATGYVLIHTGITVAGTGRSFRLTLPTWYTQPGNDFYLNGEIQAVWLMRSDSIAERHTIYITGVWDRGFSDGAFYKDANDELVIRLGGVGDSGSRDLTMAFREAILECSSSMTLDEWSTSNINITVTTDLTGLTNIDNGLVRFASKNPAAGSIIQGLSSSSLTGMSIINRQSSGTTGTIADARFLIASEQGGEGAAHTRGVQIGAKLQSDGELDMIFGTPPTRTASPIEHMYLDHTGKLGIGIDEPLEVLDVNGNIQSDGQFLSADGTAALPGYSFTSDPNSGIFGGTDILGFSTGGSEVGRFDATGNFGIGTAIPATELDVNGVTSSTALRIAAGSEAAPSIYSSTDGNSGFYWDTPDNTIGLSTGGVARLYIDNPGNVGIGTTGPTYKLDVDGSTGVRFDNYILNADQDTTGLDDYVLSFDSPTGEMTLKSISGSGLGDNLGDHAATQNIELGANWLSGDGGNEGIYVDSDGDVGIKTSSPSADLHVQDSDVVSFAVIGGAGATGSASLFFGEGLLSGQYGGIFRKADAAVNGGITSFYSRLDPLIITTADDVSNKFQASIYVETDGTVAINHSSPTEDLDVSGNTQTSGQFLSADGTAALPGYSFTSDPNSGFYLSAADEVSASTGGVRRMKIEPDGKISIANTDDYSLDLQLTIGGSGGARFNRDALTDNPYIGVGSVDPSTYAELRNFSTSGMLFNGFSTQNGIPGVSFAGYTASAPTAPSVLFIGWESDGGTGRQALSGTKKVFQFQAGYDGTFATGIITGQADGKVGIVETDPTHNLHVDGTTLIDASGVNATTKIEAVESRIYNSLNYTIPANPILTEFRVGLDSVFMRHRINTVSDYFVGINGSGFYVNLDGTNTMTVSDKVGIGNASPTYKLDVVGDAQILAGSGSDASIVVVSPTEATTSTTDGTDTALETMSATEWKMEMGAFDSFKADTSFNSWIGNFKINADQTIGVSQDNHVLVYDHSAGTWGAEPSPFSWIVSDGTSSNTITAGNTVTFASSEGIKLDENAKTVTASVETFHGSISNGSDTAPANTVFEDHLYSSFHIQMDSGTPANNSRITLPDPTAAMSHHIFTVFVDDADGTWDGEIFNTNTNIWEAGTLVTTVTLADGDIFTFRCISTDGGTTWVWAKK